MITCSAVASSVIGWASGAVFAGAFLCTVLAEGVGRANLVAVIAMKASGANASTIDGWTLGVVFAVATFLATFSVISVRTGSRARRSIPANATNTFTGPRMTELGVVLVALADFGTARSIKTIRTSTYFTFVTGPARTTKTTTIYGWARSSVLAGAIVRAIKSKLAFGATVETLLAMIAWFTNALTCDMMAVRAIVTIAFLDAVLPPIILWATISTNPTDPTGSAKTLARRWRTRTTVLTTTLRFTLVTVLTLWTKVIAEWPRITRCAMTLSRNMMTTSTVTATAQLSAILSVTIWFTFLLATLPLPTFRASAFTVERIARRSVLTFAILSACSSPFSQWTLCKIHNFTIRLWISLEIVTFEFASLRSRESYFYVLFIIIFFFFHYECCKIGNRKIS